MKAGGMMAALALAACGDAAPPPDPPAVAPAAALADSLVLRTADGREVWLTEARQATDSAGVPCAERSVEIRTGTTATRVPLLYTRLAPTLLDSQHLRAELSLNCRPIAVYRVELSTGRPTKLADR